jgi:hypothetical protein
MLKRFLRIMLLFIFTLTAACQAQQQPAEQALPWRYTDLRTLKAPGSQPASQTLAALYTRADGSEVQIRTDLLSINTEPDFDLFLALDTQPGGSHALPIHAQAGFDWDALIKVPASGPVTALDARGREIPGLKLRVVLDSFQDSVVVSLDKTAMGISRTGFSVQVFVTAAGSTELADSLGPVRSDAASPPPAQILLAFWDTFPAASPAQALRRWNGAHSGPFGGRHGLVNLLSAARAANMPLTLVDLKTPASLSALDTLEGASARLRSMIAENQLALPDVLPVEASQSGSLLRPTDWVIQRLAAEARSSAQVFQLPAEPYLYSPVSPQDLPAEALAPYRLLFTGSEQTEQPFGTPLVCQRYQSWTVLPLPTRRAALSAADVKDSQQATLDGLALETRRKLLALAAQNATGKANASNPCSGKIMLLGGNLANSAWGDPQAAQAALDYIAGHPWMRALRPEDLLGANPTEALETQAAGEVQSSPLSSQSVPYSPDSKPIASGLSIAQIQTDVLEALQLAPDGALREAAWEMYTSLLAPDFSPSVALYELRAAYLGQIGDLIAADRWAAQASEVCGSNSKRSCSYAQDVDWDGEPETILASPAYFGIFKSRGGYLAAAFAIDKNGVHQIVAPSWQFSAGLGDASAWDAKLGIAGDPGGLNGAFSDITAGYAAPSWQVYAVRLGQGEVSFDAPDGRLHKTIRLAEDGFTAQYESKDRIKVQMALTLDPWVRFSPGWEQRYEAAEAAAAANLQEWAWGLQGGPQVRLAATAGSLSAQPFTITQAWMSSPENPDYQFPPGHYLPFPMAQAVVEGEGSFSIHLGLDRDLKD